jgi:hypothetical protein
MMLSASFFGIIIDRQRPATSMSLQQYAEKDEGEFVAIDEGSSEPTSEPAVEFLAACRRVENRYIIMAEGGQSNAMSHRTTEAL